MKSIATPILNYRTNPRNDNFLVHMMKVIQTGFKSAMNNFRGGRDGRPTLRVFSNTLHRKIGGNKAEENQFNSIPPRCASGRYAARNRGRLNVVSNAKLAPLATFAWICSSMIRPACTAALSGSNGESPRAIKSAFTNSKTPASCGKNVDANVVLPAPFGPAMMIIFFPAIRLANVDIP